MALCNVGFWCKSLAVVFVCCPPVSVLSQHIIFFRILQLCVKLFEPRREKTSFLHMRKQRRRSASQ